MKIKIERYLDNGYVVYRETSTHKWKWWLPEEEIDIRGDHYCNYFKTVDVAKKAAIRAKKTEEAKKAVILEI